MRLTNDNKHTNKLTYYFRKLYLLQSAEFMATLKNSSSISTLFEMY
jgi:hypothetical protein